MIYDKHGQSVELDGVLFTIGMRVKSNDASDYANLYGVITEIRTDDDRDTDNDTTDVYCRFEPPAMPKDIEAMEAHFSKLYGQPQTVEELGLDMVIMAPDMLIPLGIPNAERVEIQIYVVVEDWAVDGVAGHDEQPFFTMEEAKLCLHDFLTEEKENGCIASWKDNDSFMLDTGETLYECWLNGEYCENHFKLCIETKKAVASKAFLQKMLHGAKGCEDAAH